MILCLDSGNTRLKWGICNADGVWLARGAVAQSNVQELLEQLQGQPDALQAVGCNVAGAEQAAVISAALQRPVRWLQASPKAGGVRNGYVVPEQLGVDRWAALLAVRAMHSGAALVVSAGTATTVDLLTADGFFCGGIIFPGVDLMRASLAQNTAQLPLAVAAYAERPQDTATAIVSGVLEAQAGAIERLFSRLVGENKHCYLGGGSAESIAPLLNMPLTYVDDLVLRGTAIMALSSP